MLKIEAGHHADRCPDHRCLVGSGPLDCSDRMCRLGREEQSGRAGHAEDRIRTRRGRNGQSGIKAGGQDYRARTRWSGLRATGGLLPGLVESWSAIKRWVDVAHSSSPVRAISRWQAGRRRGDSADCRGQVAGSPRTRIRRRRRDPDGVRSRTGDCPEESLDVSDGATRRASTIEEPGSALSGTGPFYVTSQQGNEIEMRANASYSRRQGRDRSNRDQAVHLGQIGLGRHAARQGGYAVRRRHRRARFAGVFERRQDLHLSNAATRTWSC